MPSETSVGVDRSAADELRQARREMSAAQRETLPMSEVVRRLVRLWRAWGNDPGMTDDRGPSDA